MPVQAVKKSSPDHSTSNQPLPSPSAPLNAARLPDREMNSHLDPKGARAALKVDKQICEVIHLAQTHRLPPDIKPLPAFKESVIESQIKISAFIKANKDAAVMLESLYEDLTPGVRQEMLKKKISMAAVAEQIFPHGLPDTPTRLNELQRDFLYEYGAVQVMYYRGDIRHVHRSTSPEEQAKNEAAVKKCGPDRYGENWPLMIERDKELRALIFDARERIVIDAAQQLKDKGEKKIILVYGAAHDFTGSIKEREGFNLTKVDASVRKPPGMSGTGRSSATQPKGPLTPAASEAELRKNIQ